MKRCVCLFLFALLLAGCKNESFEGCCYYSISVLLTDKAGNDLLNPANEHLFLAGDTPTVYVFDLKTNKLAWPMKEPAGIYDGERVENTPYKGKYGIGLSFLYGSKLTGVHAVGIEWKPGVRDTLVYERGKKSESVHVNGKPVGIEGQFITIVR